MDVSLKKTRPRRRHAAPSRARPNLDAPQWVEELLEENGAEAHVCPLPPELEGLVAACDALTLVSIRVPGAATLDAATFELRTAQAYTAIADQLRTRSAGHPVRFWNYIPGIHRPCGKVLDRYMVFNAGRFAACSDWFGGPEAFDRMLATASGVGHRGNDLVIHALASNEPGVAVENPRQVPPYRYSRRFGPRPPCFARATVLAPRGGRRLILVGGTASIRGEESVHLDDLEAQTLETFDNLEALVRHASDVAGAAPADLSSFTELRIYHPRPQDRPTLAPLIAAAFPALRRVEYMQADLCRAELLVEIEGVAETGEAAG